MNNSRTQTRVLIAVTHSVISTRLRRVLESKSDFTIVGEASNAAKTLALARQMAADVVLLNAAIGLQSAGDVFREISRLDTRVRIILLTADETKSEILNALRLGANGVLRENSPAPVLLKSIRCVMDDELWISRKLVGDLLDALRKASPILPTEASVSSTESSFGKTLNPERQHPRKTNSEKHAKAATLIRNSGSKKYGLTRRELQIVNAVVNGQSNLDIAATHEISERTVKHHLTHIFDKLGVNSRLELAVFALHHKLIIFPA